MIIFFFLLNINILVIRGFSLKSCRISQDIAICFKNSLTDVPTDIPPTVKGIDLSSNRILKIQVSNFTNFPVLKVLDLKQNSISHIGKDTFSRLISLKRLILNSNELVGLEDDVFNGLAKLEELCIISNHIKTVASNAFKSLKRLTLLDLSGNQLKYVKQVHLIIQHMPRLKTLSIQNNRISTFKSSDLTNKSIELKTLDVSRNPIKEFQITAHVFPNLTRLNIGVPPMKLNMKWDVQDMTMLRQVTSLDVSSVQMASNEEIRNLLSTFNSSLTSLRMNAMRFRPTMLIHISCSIPSMSTLQLERNKMFFISSNLFQKCSNVKNLDLDKNNIGRQPIENGSFASLVQLQTLSMSRNKLLSVPFAIKDLSTLSRLDLSFNLITMLDCHDLANLTNLWQLSLQWNSISALRDCVFYNLKKLKVLELQGNDMAKLNSAFQTSLPNLKVLRLNHNKLTIIKKWEFSGLGSLVNLSLFQNQIQTLEKECFTGLSSLLLLQLQINNIKKETLDKASFKDLVNLRTLDLGNNHIKYRNSIRLKEPPFIYLSSLETLNLNVQRYTQKAQLPPNFLQGLTNLLTLNCKNMQLLSFPDDFLTYTPRLDSLDISANDLKDISPALFAPIGNLTKLRVTSILLPSLDFLTEANLTKLEFLQARKNGFSVISEDIIKSVPSLLYLDLKYNSFTCDCDNSWFVNWVETNNQTQVSDTYSFDCYFPKHRKGTKLLDLNVHSCLIDIGFICFVSTTFVNVLVIVTSFTYHFMRWQLAYAYYIFLAWLFDTKKKNKQAPNQYDAFVSYNT